MLFSEIGKIVEIISGIAAQTNLLAIRLSVRNLLEMPRKLPPPVKNRLQQLKRLLPVLRHYQIWPKNWFRP